MKSNLAFVLEPTDVTESQGLGSVKLDGLRCDRVDLRPQAHLARRMGKLPVFKDPSSELFRPFRVY